MTFVLKPLAASLAVASLLSSSLSFAQSTVDPAAELATPTVIVTTNRTPLVAKDVLADNLVISADDIALSGASTVVDLLAQQRGIELSRNGGPGSVASIFVRGTANAQSVVLVDGVRISSTTVGGATWPAMPLSQIDHIEVAYGPLSSLYGADAMGGVIQIFTKKANKAFTPTFSFGLGSYGLRQEQAGISGTTDQHVQLTLNVSHEDNQGFSASKPAAGQYTYNADKDGYKQDAVSGRLSWEVASGHELGLNVMQSRINAQFDAGDGFDDINVLELSTLALFTKNKFTQDWTSSVQLAQSADKEFTNASYGTGQIDNIQNSLSWQNDIRFGKDSLQLNAEHRDEQVNAGGLAIEGSRITNSLAAAYLYRRDASLASISVRHDRSSQYGSRMTGNVAYGYRLTSALRLNASYGTSFRAPSFNELYPNYGISSNKPEQGKNVEIGLLYEEDGTQFSAVAYRNKVTDLLVYAPVCPVEANTHPYGCSYNINQATLSGLTLGASTHLGPLALRGSLDVQNPHDDTTGLLLARRAKQHGTLSAEYAMAKAKFGVETVFSGKRFDDTANVNQLPGYAIVNLYASYRACDKVTVLARFNNALNKDYELAKNYATPRSNVYVGVKYGF